MVIDEGMEQTRANKFKDLIKLYHRDLESLYPIDNLSLAIVAIEWYRVIRCIEQFMLDNECRMHLDIVSIELLQLFTFEVDRLEKLKVAPSQSSVWQAAITTVIAIG